MAATCWLSWRDKVALTPGDNEAVVTSPHGQIRLRPVEREIAAAMRRLAPPGENEDVLADSILADGNIGSLARWYYHVDRLHEHGLINRSFRIDGTLIASATSFGKSTPNTVSAVLSDDNSVMLSRFAYLRRDGRLLILESPLSHARIAFHDSRGTAVVAMLGALATPQDLANQLQQLSLEAIQAFLAFLHDAGMLDIAVGETLDSGDVRARECWEFHDLLFHARSRRGRSDGKFGGTFRFAGRRPPPPALVACDECEWHEFDALNPTEVGRHDPPLGSVQRARYSVREYGSEPLSHEQLGEFLFRVARVTEEWHSQVQTATGPIDLEYAARPYPAAGALHELDFYLAVQNCQGIPSGLYRYDPRRHRLGRRNAAARDVALLLQEAAASAGIEAGALQVLVILAARFERVAWKYESIAYSLMLKNVGVVYQTMYLAATAMGLAPCAVGCGDSDLFARAAGADYYVQSSVGEFLLGSKT